MIGQVRAAGGYSAKPLAQSVADETARRVGEKTVALPRVRQPAATATDEDVAEGARVAEKLTRDRWLHSSVAR